MADRSLASSGPSRIGVIVPSYKDVRIIHTILSIKSRDLNGITRIYVIDGGSDLELLRQIKGILRPNDYLISEKDRGIFDAINKGLDAVEENIMTWLGSDDFISRDVSFDDVVHSFDQEDLDCYVFDTVFVDGVRPTRRTSAVAPTKANMRIGRHPHHFSSYWRMSRIGENRFNLLYTYAADQEFFCKIAWSGTLKTKLNRTVGTIARLGGASSKNRLRLVAANVDAYRAYKTYMGSLGALAATVGKLSRKFASRLSSPPYAVIDEMTELIVNSNLISDQ